MPELKETIARLRVLTENFREDSDGFGVDRPDLVLLLDAAEEVEKLRADKERLDIHEERQWCVVPPNQEADWWSVFKEFDGEFGYQDEIATGNTLREAIDAARESLQTHGRGSESTAEAKQAASPARKEKTE